MPTKTHKSVFGLVLNFVCHVKQWIMKSQSIASTIIVSSSPTASSPSLFFFFGDFSSRHEIRTTSVHLIMQIEIKIHVKERLKNVAYLVKQQGANYAGS